LTKELAIFKSNKNHDKSEKIFRNRTVHWLSKQIPAFQKEVYERFSQKIFALCLRYVKETAAAEEVLIIGFMKIFDRIHQFQGKNAFAKNNQIQTFGE
jgi:hypothetical protein